MCCVTYNVDSIALSFKWLMVSNPSDGFKSISEEYDFGSSVIWPLQGPQTPTEGENHSNIIHLSPEDPGGLGFRGE